MGNEPCAANRWRCDECKGASMLDLLDASQSIKRGAGGGYPASAAYRDLSAGARDDANLHGALQIQWRRGRGVPYAELVRDPAGNLYGTTGYGGNTSSSCPTPYQGCGVVFKTQYSLLFHSPPGYPKPTKNVLIIPQFVVVPEFVGRSFAARSSLPRASLIMLRLA